MLGCGGDEVSIMSVVSPCGLVSVSSLGSFLTVSSSSKRSNYSLPISPRARHIKDYFKKKIGSKQRSIKTQEEKAGREEKRNQMIVTV